jgi:hypothetical protein
MSKNKYIKAYLYSFTRAAILLILFLPFFIYSQNPQWIVYTHQNSPLPSNIVGKIVFDKNNNIWIGTLEGLVKIDNNWNWTIYDTLNSPIPMNGAFVQTVDSNNIIWVAFTRPWGTGGGIGKYDGANWTFYNSTNSGLPQNQVSDIEVDVLNRKWITTFYGIGVYNDTSWILYNSSNSPLPCNDISAITFEENIKWISTMCGGLVKYDGSNWTVYNYNNSGIPSDQVRNVSIDMNNNKWVCTYAWGVGKFNSSLNQWTVYNSTNSGLPGNYSLRSKADKNNSIWIGTADGLAKFYNNNWTVFTMSNSPLPGDAVGSIHVDNYNNKWFGVAGGVAIYNELGVVETNNGSIIIPKRFNLYQNYPNPFNPVTNIKYELNNISFIKLSVIDITGKIIKVLFEGKQNAGLYETEFNAEYLSSGIYFYKLETEKYSETKKMILLK